MIMKRKITWKQLFSSSVIRVMCIVIAVMIPVNVVTILLGKMAVNRAEEQFASETKGALDLYMLQVEDARSAQRGKRSRSQLMMWILQRSIRKNHNYNGIL